MLQVPNRTTWNNYYKQSTLYNCDIKVSTFNTLIVDSKNIVDFSYVARNSYVCFDLPNEEVSFKIVNFNQLSTRVYLQKNKPIYITYIVNGTETTTGKIFIVNSIKVDMKGNFAIVKATSLIDNLFASGKEYLLLDRVGTTNTYNRTSLVLYTLLNDYPYLSVDFGTFDRDIDMGNIMFTDLTNAQIIQNLVVASGCGLDVKGKKNAYHIYDEFNLRELNVNDIDCVIDNKNIYVDCDLIDNKNDYSNIYYIEDVVGYDNDISETITLSQIGGNTLKGTWNKPNDVMIDYQHTTFTGAGTATTSVYNDKIEVVVSGNSALSSYAVISYKNVKNRRDFTLNAPTFKSRFWTKYSSSESDVDTKVQNNARRYYQKGQTVVFSCRIDPTIETLDVIAFELYDKFYRVAVEEINMSFNGGFKGTIRARVLELTDNDEIEAPIVFDIDYVNKTFKVKNINPVDVKMSIYYSSLEYEDINVPAGETITITATEYSAFNYLFNLYNAQTLDYDVYCYFETDIATSDNTIILEANL